MAYLRSGLSRLKDLLLFVLGFTLVSVVLPFGTAVADYKTVVTIPVLRVGPAPTPTPSTPQPSPIALSMCTLITSSPEQHRPYMVRDPILQQVAQAKADDMATRNYFSHTNPDGLGPNYFVRAAGYTLPSYYGKEPTANNVESLAAGGQDTQAIWDAWMASSGHRVHVLGETAFFAQQVDYGVGYAYNPNSAYKHYWVFVSAQKNP